MEDHKMCRIFGKYAAEGVTTESLERMARVLVHRDRDDVGIYVVGSIGLGNRRLSIIDLKNGRQPISNQDGMSGVQGEIYNYRSLLVVKKEGQSKALSLLRPIIQNFAGKN
jgi:asparagine synthase (glutamine-hydrolysing)